MVLMTMIARVADGLPLAASVQEEEQTGRSLLEYQAQAKQLFRRMNNNTPTRGSLETGSYLFHYYVERGVCYLVLCEKSFSKRQAFAYLEELQTEFAMQYGHKFGSVSRPYSFIEFGIMLAASVQPNMKSPTLPQIFTDSMRHDTFIQKTKKSYMDSRSRRNFGQLNNELQDVQRIMVQNIDDVLTRGEALSALDDKASNLATLSQKYKKDAHYLNLKSSYFKIAAIVVVFIVILLFIRYWFF